MNALSRFLTASMVLAFSVPALAEGAQAAGEVSLGHGLNIGLGYLGAGLAIGLAVLGGGQGQGRAAAGALDGIARNPQSASKVFTPFLISLALIEFQAIMAFIIAILLVGK